MYNDRIEVADIEQLGVPVTQNTDGSVTVEIKGKRLRMRRSKMYPLWLFRDLFIPAEGLWEHYFRCSKCDWSRQDPKIAVCIYCNIPMTEMGSPGQFLREESGVKVLRIRPDLMNRIQEDIDLDKRLKMALDKNNEIRPGVFNLASLLGKHNA
jgi:hypothetical protein